MHYQRDNAEPETFMSPPAADFASAPPGIPLDILELVVHDAGRNRSEGPVADLEVQAEEFGYCRVAIRRRGSRDLHILGVTWHFKTRYVACRIEAISPAAGSSRDLGYDRDGILPWNSRIRQPPGFRLQRWATVAPASCDQPACSEL